MYPSDEINNKGEIGETRLTRKLKNGGEGISSGIDRSENKSTTRRGKAPSV